MKNNYPLKVVSCKSEYFAEAQFFTFYSENSKYNAGKFSFDEMFKVV